MKVYKGDIVEVITARYASMNEWRKDDEYIYYTDYGKLLMPYVGLRFRVHEVNGTQIIWDRTGKPGQIAILHPTELMIYNRPFLNRLKYIMHLITGKCARLA